jgi:hypothetical protein
MNANIIGIILSNINKLTEVLNSLKCKLLLEISLKKVSYTEDSLILYNFKGFYLLNTKNFRETSKYLDIIINNYEILAIRQNNELIFAKDDEVFHYDIDNGELIKQYKLPYGFIRGIKLLKDPAFIAFNYENEINIMTESTLALKSSIKMKAKDYTMCGCDNQSIAYSLNNKAIKYDFEGGKELFIYASKSKQITQLVYLREDILLAYNSNNYLSLINNKTGKLENAFTINCNMGRITSLNSNNIICTDGSCVRIINLKSRAYGIEILNIKNIDGFIKKDAESLIAFNNSLGIAVFNLKKKSLEKKFNKRFPLRSNKYIFYNFCSRFYQPPLSRIRYLVKLNYELLIIYDQDEALLYNYRRNKIVKRFKEVDYYTIHKVSKINSNLFAIQYTSSTYDTVIWDYIKLQRVVQKDISPWVYIEPIDDSTIALVEEKAIEVCDLHTLNVICRYDIFSDIGIVKLKDNEIFSSYKESYRLIEFNTGKVFSKREREFIHWRQSIRIDDDHILFYTNDSIAIRQLNVRNNKVTKVFKVGYYVWDIFKIGNGTVWFISEQNKKVYLEIWDLNGCKRKRIFDLKECFYFS